jgi:hypothetical protein
MESAMAAVEVIQPRATHAFVFQRRNDVCAVSAGMANPMSTLPPEGEKIEPSLQLSIGIEL